MLNLLEDYIPRSLPEQGGFATNPGLTKKVNENGGLLPFYGNTAVFLLDAATKDMLSDLQRELYDAAGWMLAEPMAPQTFHMTLHDLVNGQIMDSDLSVQMESARKKAEHILRWWQEEPPLKMKATWMFNMVSTSIVLGFAPVNEDSYYRLDAMYGALEVVMPLGYALTPHITLAYFRPGQYTQAETDCLRRALRPVDWTLELRMEDLRLQDFRDMNTYL